MWYTNTKTGHAIDLSQVNYFYLIDPAHEDGAYKKPLIVFHFLDNEKVEAEFQNIEQAQTVIDEIAAMLNGDTIK